MGNAYTTWVSGALRSSLGYSAGNPRRYLGRLCGPDAWCTRCLAGPGRNLVAYQGPYKGVNIPPLRGKSAWMRDNVGHTGAAHSHIYKIVSRIDYFSPHRF